VFGFEFRSICRGFLHEIQWYRLVVFCAFCQVMMGSTVVLVLPVVVVGVFVACWFGLLFWMCSFLFLLVRDWVGLDVAFFCGDWIRKPEMGLVL